MKYTYELTISPDEKLTLDGEFSTYEAQEIKNYCEVFKRKLNVEVMRTNGKREFVTCIDDLAPGDMVIGVERIVEKFR